jgi:hypothetical protein
MPTIDDFARHRFKVRLAAAFGRSSDPESALIRDCAMKGLELLLLESAVLDGVTTALDALRPEPEPLPMAVVSPAFLMTEPVHIPSVWTDGAPEPESITVPLDGCHSDESSEIAPETAEQLLRAAEEISARMPEVERVPVPENVFDRARKYIAHCLEIGQPIDVVNVHEITGLNEVRAYRFIEGVLREKGTREQYRIKNIPTDPPPIVVGTPPAALNSDPENRLDVHVLPTPGKRPYNRKPKPQEAAV